jgi:hypothetical protein
MSAEAMAAVDYVMRKVWEEIERSIDEELLRKFENQQFNWVQINPIYRG